MSHISFFWGAICFPKFTILSNILFFKNKFEQNPIVQASNQDIKGF
jgi:hypothetical protein